MIKDDMFISESGVVMANYFLYCPEPTFAVYKSINKKMPCIINNSIIYDLDIKSFSKDRLLFIDTRYIGRKINDLTIIGEV